MKKLLFSLACVLGLSLIVSCNNPVNVIDVSDHSYIYSVEGSYTYKLSTTKQYGVGTTLADFIPDATPAVATSYEVKTVAKKAIISWQEKPYTNYKNYTITLYSDAGKSTSFYVDYYDSKYWLGTKDITSFLNGGNLEEATSLIGTLEYEPTNIKVDSEFDYTTFTEKYYKSTDTQSDIFNLTFTMISNDSKKKK